MSEGLSSSLEAATWPSEFQLSLWTSLVLRVYVPIVACFPVLCSGLRNYTQTSQPSWAWGAAYLAVSCEGLWFLKGLC